MPSVLHLVGGSWTGHVCRSWFSALGTGAGDLRGPLLRPRVLHQPPSSSFQHSVIPGHGQRGSGRVPDPESPWGRCCWRSRQGGEEEKGHVVSGRAYCDHGPPGSRALVPTMVTSDPSAHFSVVTLPLS